MNDHNVNPGDEAPRDENPRPEQEDGLFAMRAILDTLRDIGVRAGQRGGRASQVWTVFRLANKINKVSGVDVPADLAADGYAILKEILADSRTEASHG